MKDYKINTELRSLSTDDLRDVVLEVCETLNLAPGAAIAEAIVRRVMKRATLIQTYHPVVDETPPKEGPYR